MVDESKVKRSSRSAGAKAGAVAKAGGRAEAAATAPAVTVDGGDRPQQRRQSRPAWSAAKEERFFERLAESCNVLMAAEHAGVRPQRAYERRGRDAAFRGRWDQALAVGYAQLELMLLQRTLHGVEKVVTARNGDTSIMREYSDRTALALLRMHRDAALEAGEDVDQDEYREACERILDRLDRIREREDKGPPVETKAGPGLAERIKETLRWRRGAMARVA